MAEVYDQIQATDSAGSKFVGVRVNTGAAGEFLAVAGDTVVTEQTKRVASMRVNVSSAAGMGAAIGVGTDVASPADGSGTIVSNLRAMVIRLYQGLPASLGQKAKAASLPVVFASDQDALPVLKVSAAVITTVTASATTGTLKAVNTNRLGLIVNNDADKTMRMKYGATASLTSYTVKIPAGGYWEMPQPIYTGVVDALWDAAPTGSAIISEI